MEHFSQNDSILVRQGENCASAWIHTCSVLASAGCCRHIIEEYVRKHNRRTRVKALVSVCFTFPSSGPHASGSCTSLDKNFDADSAFKSFMLSTRWGWQPPNPFWGHVNVFVCCTVEQISAGLHRHYCNANTEL